MQCRRFTHFLIAGLIGLGWISESKAQSITTGALPVTQICGSSSLSVSFTTTGTFGTGNVFSVELSNSAGGFASPVTLAPSGTGSPLVVTIPNNLTNGSGYQVRVVSSNPQVNGSASATTLTIQQTPVAPAVAQTSFSYCQNATATQLSATAAGGNTLKWYDGSNNPLPGAPTPSTAATGTQTYRVSQETSTGCESARTTITVEVNGVPAAPTATSPIEICQGSPSAALTATGTSLKWYDASNNPIGGAPIPSNTVSSSYGVTQTVNGCESPKEKIDVRIKPLPSATISGDVSVALGQSAQISIAFTGDGPWDYVLSNNLSDKGVTQNPVRITVSPERTTTYVVTEVSNSCGKGIPNGSAIVTVLVPTISTGNPTIASLCAGRSFTIPFQASGTFVPENKFNVQLSLTNTDAGFRSIPSVRNGSEIIATVPDTTRGGNYFVRIVGESPQFTIKGSVSPVNVTVQPLPTATISGTTTILIGESATVNVAFTGAGPWTFTFNNGSRDSVITTSVTPLAIPVKPAVTTTYTITSLSNQCGLGRVSGNARIQVDPILGNEPTLPAADWLTVYPSPVQTICVVEIKAPLAGGEATLRIFDTNGRAVLTSKVRSSRTDVDFTAQPAGIYFLRIDNGARTEVRRILKLD